MATSTELPLNSTANSTCGARIDATPDEIALLKRHLLQAEVHLAKAAGAEADVKVLGTRLRAVSCR